MFVWSRLSSAQWSDSWAERFSGHNGAVITVIPGRKTVRVELYCVEKREALTVQRQFGGTVRPVRSRNWAALRLELPPPVVVRNALLVSAASDKAKLAALAKANPRRTIISIPPDMAFGTGHHATTASVLRLLVDFSKSRKGQAWTLCDLGTGSGVLAIAAAKLGARDIYGCDFDPHAVRVALHNVKRNRAGGVRIEEADVLRWKSSQRYDCVAANLFSDVLIAAFPKIVRIMKPGGTVLVSGILKSQSAECLRAGEKAGLKFDTIITKGKWVTARGRREDFMP
ncbi:MAG: 50S ribosomal protein L11 methyltransferase [Verrucomicrobia bacterium]|nr:50S ribosomal protein L11 methyltransferase [Verrucomicrobiota bacterium]